MATATNEMTREDALYYTEGEGSEYRTTVDENGTKRVNKEKVVKGAERAKVDFKFSLPKLTGPSWDDFKDAFKMVATTGTIQQAFYDSGDIEKVNTGGFIGNIANKVIQKKYGQS